MCLSIWSWGTLTVAGLCVCMFLLFFVSYMLCTYYTYVLIRSICEYLCVKYSQFFANFFESYNFWCFPILILLFKQELDLTEKLKTRLMSPTKVKRPWNYSLEFLTLYYWTSCHNVLRFAVFPVCRFAIFTFSAVYCFESVERKRKWINNIDK